MTGLCGTRETNEGNRGERGWGVCWGGGGWCAVEPGPAALLRPAPGSRSPAEASRLFITGDKYSLRTRPGFTEKRLLSK